MPGEVRPHDCAECKENELVLKAIGVVAKHWVLAHPSYLEVLKAAVVLAQGQQMGMDLHG